MQPALPHAGMDLVYFQQSLPTADSALDPISPMVSCPICAPENDSYLSSKIPKLFRRFCKVVFCISQNKS